MPLALPPHPHIVTILHHYLGNTAPFHRFLRLLVPPGLDVDVTMAARSTFVVMPVYSGSLKSWAASRAAVTTLPATLYGGAPAPPSGASIVQGVCEREWALVGLQALRAVAFLREYGVAHRDIKADNWFLDGAERLVLADFGGAITLLRPHNRRPLIFQRPSDAFCCNAMAWDPHVARLSRTGPPPTDDDMTLVDVYDKVCGGGEG